MQFQSLSTTLIHFNIIQISDYILPRLVRPHVENRIIPGNVPLGGKKYYLLPEVRGVVEFLRLQINIYTQDLPRNLLNIDFYKKKSNIYYKSSKPMVLLSEHTCILIQIIEVALNMKQTPRSCRLNEH
jgi:hypothetical protein